MTGTWLIVPLILIFAGAAGIYIGFYAAYTQQIRLRVAGIFILVIGDAVYLFGLNMVLLHLLQATEGR